MKEFLCIILLFPLFMQSQVNYSNNQIREKNGLRWNEGLSWNQVKAKAKHEDKYIFVDCFATWCGPCKFMDKYVYTNDTLYKYLNENFVSVKFQMDKTKHDTEIIMNLYGDADLIKSKYKVSSYPTVLLFSPDGYIIGRFEGVKSTQAIISKCRSITISDNRYHRLLREYLNDSLSSDLLKELAIKTKSLGDAELSLKIAERYLTILDPNSLSDKSNVSFLREFRESKNACQLAQRYIMGLDNDSLFVKSNLEFLASFIYCVSKRGYDIFKNYSSKVNTIVGDEAFSKKAIDFLVYKEVIEPLENIAKDNDIDPKWEVMEEIIRRKYGLKLANRMVLHTKIVWYQNRKDWSRYSNYANKYIENGYVDKSSPVGNDLINSICWEIFLHSYNTNEIKRSARFMKNIIDQDSCRTFAFIDTYANLLYKLGDKAEALKWEYLALSKAPDDVEIQNTLLKMKRGEATWVSGD